MITEERFTYNFQHLMTSYERLENGVVAASKQFVRLGLLEMQERDGSGTVTAENAWRPDTPGGIGEKREVVVKQSVILIFILVMKWKLEIRNEDVKCFLMVDG